LHLLVYLLEYMKMQGPGNIKSISVYKGNSIQQTQHVLYYLYQMKKAQLLSEKTYIFNIHFTMDNIKHSIRTANYWWILNWKDVKEHYRENKLHVSAQEYN
jgi:hypothetical protein